MITFWSRTGLVFHADPHEQQQRQCADEKEFDGYRTVGRGGTEKMVAGTDVEEEDVVEPEAEVDDEASEVDDC